MQQRAGLLFLAKTTGRILLILENSAWTVPTFARVNAIYDDAKPLLDSYQVGKLLPIELYLSEDKGFEYGTYVCLVEEEFLTSGPKTLCWADLDYLPKHLHTGLKTTLNNQLIRAKLDTILVLENVSKITTR
jgi:hypothetical protein